jgi:hypothetical protein
VRARSYARSHTLSSIGAGGIVVADPSNDVVLDRGLTFVVANGAPRAPQARTHARTPKHPPTHIRARARTHTHTPPAVDLRAFVVAER